MSPSMIIERSQHSITVATAMDENQPCEDEQMKMTEESTDMTGTTNGDDGGGDNGNNNNEEDQPVDDEPNWDEIMQHDPARTEVPIFLAARSRGSEANQTLAAGLDLLHDSVTQSMEGLVEVVTALLNSRAEKLYEYEVNLKNDYVYNEKTRASMQVKLEESARAAQGLFANLLMRVAQPGEEAAGASALGGAAGTAGNQPNANPNEGGGNNNDGNGGEEEEPDWDAIMLHEPARSEVPTFLAARARREAACARFEAAIEEFQTSIDNSAQELTQTVADLYNSRTVKLDEYEQILKHDYVANDKMRAKMQSNLEESASAAHNMFEELMKRVMQPQSHEQQQQQPVAAMGVLTQAATLGDSP